MTWWNITLMVVCLVVCGLFALFGVLAIASAKSSIKAYREDERNWKAFGSRGVAADARIVRLGRHPQRLTKAGNYRSNQVAATDIRIAYTAADGISHEVDVRTFVDTSLLANFTPGTAISIVVSPEDSMRVAVDRNRTLLEIER
nr:hypothetical protein [Rhodococcus sp. (in: high G+C Gram-positive bacteria)]